MIQRRPVARLNFSFEYKQKVFDFIEETLVSTLTKVEVAVINIELNLDAGATYEAGSSAWKGEP